MQFVSTRNPDKKVSFSKAVLDCIPSDGGLYTPAYEENLSSWILYMNENTSFTSIAGSLTSALIKEEFSPIISEAIATNAFPFEPALTQLDDRLYHLELYHGPTGSHKDFGISYLASCLEHICIMKETEAIVITDTTGETGSSIAQAFRNKKHLKAVLLYPKDAMRGLSSEDFIWNGGNIYPVEVNGSIDDCIELVRQIYNDRPLVEKYGLTLANTSNIGRLLPQTFFYTFAFTRLKNRVCSDIFYALSSSNYGNLIAGLYSWKFSLPVNGFITDCTASLRVDPMNMCELTDANIPLLQRGPANPAVPSNLERLESLFMTSPAVMKGLVFPAEVSKDERKTAAQQLLKNYNIKVSPQTADAYAAAVKRTEMVEEDGGVVVLISRDHPAFSSEVIRQMCGEEPEMPEHIAAVLKKMKSGKVIEPLKEEVLSILKEIKPE